LQETLMKLRPQSHGSSDTSSGGGAYGGMTMAARIIHKLETQQGRELPGFLSTQVFFSEVVEFIELWRPLVEACKGDVLNRTMTACSRLLYLVMCGSSDSGDGVADYPVSVIYSVIYSVLGT
jgi:hypothetical protein